MRVGELEVFPSFAKAEVARASEEPLVDLTAVLGTKLQIKRCHPDRGLQITVGSASGSVSGTMGS